MCRWEGVGSQEGKSLFYLAVLLGDPEAYILRYKSNIKTWYKNIIQLFLHYALRIKKSQSPITGWK